MSASRAFVFSAVVLVLAPATASAQTAEARYAAEQYEIGREAGAADALYIASAALGFLGTWPTAIGWIADFNCVNAISGRSCDTSGPTLAGAIGSVVAGLGFFLACVAFGLDIDSRSRRAGLEARHAAHASLAPGPGEIGLALAFSLDE